MPSPVFLKSISLSRFRNHQATRLDVSQPGGRAASVVLLVGANGAGKTNILEAISLLAVGRGLRGSALAHMAGVGPALDGVASGGFQIKADLLPDPGLPPVTLLTGTLPTAPDRRLLRVNGVAASLSSLSEWASQLWLTPAMDRLFADTASVRRRFLDRLVLALYPGHAGHASRYEAAMRARTRLLTAEAPADPHWLDALELQMAEHGAALSKARADTIEALAWQLEGMADGAFPRPSPALSVEGVLEEAYLLQQLRQLRRVDQAAGRATFGPHKVDLLVTHAEKQMPAALASTGEQKALLISLLLAHAALVAERTGRVPILLLDEAVAHLDPNRRLALFSRIADLGGQAWLTGTDANLFEGLEACRFHVENGSVSSI